MEKLPLITTFINSSDDESMFHWHKKEVEVLHLIANPKDESEMNADAMPQFKIRLISTGEETTVYVDELPSDFSTPELDAVLAGQNACITEKKENLYIGELARYFDFGVEIGEIKGLSPALSVYMNECS